MTYSLQKTATLGQLQKFISDVYSLPDDRLYSIWDLLIQQERFAMRTLKGIRKGDTNKIKTNLLVSLSWLMAIANRLHINAEDEVWKRFPMLCSYCGKKPCVCKKTKPVTRIKLKANNISKPINLMEFQKMFNEIYPARDRSITAAGVHLAEEMGEVSETIHNYLGQHLQKQFDNIKLEIADFISCVFGVANSANINVAEELSHMFSNGCHICHKVPCVCTFIEIIGLES